MEKRRDLSNHITTEQLLDFVERRLTPAESSEVENHIATGCQSCQADLLWWQDTLNLMASNIWLDPPARLHTSARRIFLDQQKSKPTFFLGEWLRRLSVQPRPLFVGAAAMLFLVIIAGIMLLSGPANSSSTEIAIVQGTAEVQTAGSNAWVPASEDETLQDGSTVRTGDDSSVVLTFPDASKVLIAPDTELSVLRMNAQSNSSTRVIVLRQTSGSTHNIVQHTSSSASRYEVQTPSAVVTVMGTEFTVDVDDEGTTRVLVDKGTVTVAGQGVTITLNAGQTTTVNVGEPPSRVETIPKIRATQELTNKEENESNSRARLSAVEPNASATPTPTSNSTDTNTPTGTPNTNTPIGTSTKSASSTPATPSQSATEVIATPQVTPSSTPSVPTPLPSATNTPPVPTPLPTATNTPPVPTPVPTATSTPSALTPPPTATEIVPPTPQPTNTPKNNPHDPPGQTKTPEPPGHMTPDGSGING